MVSHRHSPQHEVNERWRAAQILPLTKRACVREHPLLGRLALLGRKFIAEKNAASDDDRESWMLQTTESILAKSILSHPRKKDLLYTL